MLPLHQHYFTFTLNLAKLYYQVYCCVIHAQLVFGCKTGLLTSIVTAVQVE